MLLLGLRGGWGGLLGSWWAVGQAGGAEPGKYAFAGESIQAGPSGLSTGAEQVAVPVLVGHGSRARAKS